MALNAPKLENWITLPEAGKILGVSIQAVHDMAESGKFQSLRSLGSKPIYVVWQEEVLYLRDERELAEEAHQEKLVERDRSRFQREASRHRQLGYIQDDLW